jgi:ribosomal protein S18 acetylase RimI-like enzyme
MLTIKPSTIGDKDAILEIARKTGLFDGDELSGLDELFSRFVTGSLGVDHYWVTLHDENPVGVAYFAPEKYSNRVWNLYFIATDPERHGRGLGSELIGYIEEFLRLRGERMLLVETSSKLEGPSKFYIKQGFQQEGRIRDYYGDGDDKIIFRKKLGTPGRRSWPLDTPGYSLEPASLNELPVLLELVRAYFVFDHLLFDDMTETAIAKLISNPQLGQYFFIRGFEGTVGYCCLTYSFDAELWGQSGVITDLFLVETSRGRGLGRAVIHGLTEVAKSEGCNGLELWVIDDNHRAKRLYESLGFEGIAGRSMMTLRF